MPFPVAGGEEPFSFCRIIPVEELRPMFQSEFVFALFCGCAQVEELVVKAVAVSSFSSSYASSSG